MVFEHYYGILHRVFLWQIEGDMRMVKRKSHLAKLEAKGFEFPESCNAGVYDALPAKALVSAFCDELQCYPVISCVFSSCHYDHLRKIFIAEAIKKQFKK